MHHKQEAIGFFCIPDGDRLASWFVDFRVKMLNWLC